VEGVESNSNNAGMIPRILIPEKSFGVVLW
jgi:hypothetical protein